MSLGGLGNPKRSLGDSKKTMYLFARRHHRPQCLPCSFQNIGECNFCPISLDPRFCYTCTLQHPKNTSCTNTGGSQLTPKFPTIIPSYITRDKPSWNHFQANGMKGKKQMQCKIVHLHLPRVGQRANPMSKLNPQKPLPCCWRILKQLSSFHR